MGEVCALRMNNWGQAAIGTSGGSFEPFNTWLSNENFGLRLNNIGATIPDDIEAIWIGSNSEADAVQIYAPQSELVDASTPIGVSVGNPFVGRIRGPVHIYQNTPSPTFSLGHLLDLYYVRSGQDVPSSLPIVRAPRRYYYPTSVAAGSVSDYIIPTFGRKLVNIQFKNGSINSIQLNWYAVQGNHDQGLGIATSPMTASDRGIPAIGTANTYVVLGSTCINHAIVSASAAPGAAFGYADWVVVRLTNSTGSSQAGWLSFYCAD